MQGFQVISQELAFSLDNSPLTSDPFDRNQYSITSVIGTETCSGAEELASLPLQLCSALKSFHLPCNKRPSMTGNATGPCEQADILSPLRSPALTPCSREGLGRGSGLAVGTKSVSASPALPLRAGLAGALRLLRSPRWALLTARAVQRLIHRVALGTHRLSQQRRGLE